MRKLAATFVILMIATAGPGLADHIGLHTTPCDAADTVGGGQLGVSPGPVGPPDSLGWDVGNGQCNGSFAVATGAGVELGMRAEQRSVGQVARIGADDYEVQLGHDTTAGATNRAWWNFQQSIAGDIAGLASLTFEIQTDVGPNLPAAASVDMLALRAAIDDRNGNPGNATSTYGDLYQTSQNPEFGWFTPTSDTDGNPTGAFDYGQEGAWRMKLTAVDQTGGTASVSICIHTPGAACSEPVPAFGRWAWLFALLMLGSVTALWLRRVRAVAR